MPNPYSTAAAQAARHAYITITAGALLALIALVMLTAAIGPRPDTSNMSAALVTTLLCTAVAALFALLRYSQSRALFEEYHLGQRPLGQLLLGQADWFVRYATLAYVACLLTRALLRIRAFSGGLWLHEAGLLLPVFALAALPWLIGPAVATLIVAKPATGSQPESA
ncbi:hypothetical protein [Hymenobacter latericus]|uniref:hypothetical protein n=1 Tax=Hymenobacter sp. YIM 151858-1 TaxID=2987688 RepID=UPI002227F3D1|nr:hypothetical protein [Hymenobacter sp. YIM 151858-1]UYZ59139.1 hypothetical protein OIS50_19055 [Hymenobacter sp. YIM 151858-1]